MRATAKLFAGTILAGAAVLMPSMASAQEVGSGNDTSANEAENDIVGTCSRIQRTELTATSTVTTFDQEQIVTYLAVQAEVITSRIPPFAGGDNAHQPTSEYRPSVV